MEQSSITWTNCILSTAYIPSIRYISKFLLYENIFIENHENYSKQSYRNRCIICSTNGPLTLSIPIRKEKTPKINIRNVKIDYSDNWQKDHLRGIESAYRHAPYFEYYYDDLKKTISERFELLIELNEIILINILEWLEIEINLLKTEDYENYYVYGDYRNSIHPKKRMQKSDNNFKPIEYSQVFKEKHGFLEDLSIIDLIFNKGPESYQILKRSI